MKTTLLFLLTFINWTSADNRAVASLTPDRSQYFEYEDITVRCEHMGSDDWTVWRYTTKESVSQMSQCRQGWGVQASSSCDMKTVKQPTSGVYWCQSKQGHSSNAVNITVTDHPLILQSPVRPVAAGEIVTLFCKNQSFYRSAAFYKNGVLIRKMPDDMTINNMTIHNFSKSDEGAYKCDIRGLGESPPAWLLIQDSVQTLSPSPDSSQLSEYDNLSLSCGNNISFHGWTIKRFTAVSGRLSSCGVDWGKTTSSGCIVQTVKELDSAIYWCESPARQRSNSLNITVYNAPVILQSPVLPVEAGENTTLLCKSKTPSSNLQTDFYKDGTFVRTTPTGHMTIHHVSKSDEGVYKCDIRGLGESPPAWLFVTGDGKGGAFLFDPSLTVFVIIRVVVSSPYVVSTLLLVSIVRQRPTEKAPPVSLTTPPPGEDEEGLEYEDVTTEHRF